MGSDGVSNFIALNSAKHARNSWVVLAEMIIIATAKAVRI